MYTDPEHGAEESQSMFQRIINWLNPSKKAWYKKDEWYVKIRNQSAYKVAEKHDCPSWDLEFWFLKKYKNKETCEERWMKSSRSRMLDRTIFEEPEEWIKDKGKSESHYILFEEAAIYNGDKYE
jgi:hypothetical protein